MWAQGIPTCDSYQQLAVAQNFQLEVAPLFWPHLIGLQTSVQGDASIQPDRLISAGPLHLEKLTWMETALTDQQGPAPLSGSHETP